jgi:putrescine transport system permease protein
MSGFTLRKPRWWRGRTVVIGIPYLWLLAFFFTPFLIVLKFSVSEMGVVSVEPVLTVVDGIVRLAVKYSNYVFITTDDLYFKAYLSSVKYAAVTTLCCLLIGYPFAYFMARTKASLQPTLLMLVMLPFWTSFLLRVYAWKGLLNEGGWVAELLSALNVDQVLLAFGMIQAADKYLHTPFSLVVGMTYTYLPFMILPLYANLAKLDLRLLEAAADLGATPWVAFWKVTVPLSKAGIIAVHSLRGRVRHTRAAGRPRDADDRPRAVGRILQQQRLAHGLVRRGGAGAADRAAAGPVQQVPGGSTGGEEMSPMSRFPGEVSTRWDGAQRQGGWK